MKTRLSAAAAVLGGGLFAACSACLYQKMTVMKVGKGAFTYSLSYTIPIVFGAVVVYLVAVLRIRRIIINRKVTFDEGEDVPVREEEEAVLEETSDIIAYDMPAYPETEPVVTAAQQRAEKIASALAAQRSVEIDFPADEEEAPETADMWDALYPTPALKEEADIHDLYANLPAELPPGYTLPQESPEEESAEFPEEEIEEEVHPRSPVREMLPVVCVLAVFVMLLLAASSFWIKAGEDGIWVSRMGKVREYAWDQVAAYTVDAQLSGGELVLKFQMEDGLQVKIAPASYAETEIFADQYENLYQYWLQADHKLSALGADKTVIRAEYLVDTYMFREDGSWQYVQQLIDYEEEIPWQE